LFTNADRNTIGFCLKSASETQNYSPRSWL
jgi:hypothetical protein